MGEPARCPVVTMGRVSLLGAVSVTSIDDGARHRMAFACDGLPSFGFLPGRLLSEQTRYG